MAGSDPKHSSRSRSRHWVRVPVTLAAAALGTAGLWAFAGASDAAGET